MDHAHPMIAKTARGQGSMDVGLIANEEQGLDPWVSGQGAPRALNHDPAAMVAAHDIHCNSHKMQRTRSFAPRLKTGLAFRGNGDDLTAFIETASGADPMGHVGSCTLGASAELRQAQDTVVGPAHALAAF